MPPKPLLSIIVAAAENDVIGQGNRLPWRLPDDLRRFKSLSMGKPIIMGRRTFESIGRALPGRTNIVVSGQPGLELDGCIVVPSVDAAIAAVGSAPQAVIAGGAQIYRQVLPRVGMIHLTRVHVRVAGDVYFPALVPDEWLEVQRERHAADEAHAHAFSFITLERIPR
ncbi:dihydrofolate reductase [Steroidobacter denitrificans]|uniref:Dihydrofolate reductase n=1 Tax=Steroidobacter denitrificans TaxID=465721 RepID=A0A127FAR6_STEDE|nr:dihydrofolate reductase [Steroidobacter denitrificans]AMN46698.1 dihydrofolate reductase [Steroidobacter denitrificans]